MEVLRVGGKNIWSSKGLLTKIVCFQSGCRKKTFRIFSPPPPDKYMCPLCPQQLSIVDCVGWDVDIELKPLFHISWDNTLIPNCHRLHGYKVDVRGRRLQHFCCLVGNMNSTLFYFNVNNYLYSKPACTFMKAQFQLKVWLASHCHISANGQMHMNCELTYYGIMQPRLGD